MAKDNQAKDPVAQASLWGGIASAASSIFSTGAGLAGMLNADARDAQVRIAEANAQAAMAGTNSTGQLFGVNKNYILIGGGVLALIIVLMIFKRK